MTGFSGSVAADRLVRMHRRAVALLVALLVGSALLGDVARSSEDVPFDLIELIVREISPGLLYFAFELLPFACRDI